MHPLFMNYIYRGKNRKPLPAPYEIGQGPNLFLRQRCMKFFKKGPSLYSGIAEKGPGRQFLKKTAVRAFLWWGKVEKI